MRLLVYRTVTGIPQRVLSVSQRVQSPGGEFHEGDDAVPRQFIEAAYILSESQRPSPFVLSETDLTPEVIAEKAKKYDILPEDYVPMSVTYGGAYGGDYPTVAEEAYHNKDFYYEWDIMKHKRNFGEIIGMHDFTHFHRFHRLYDGHLHIYGFWKYKQGWILYLEMVLFWLYGYIIHSWFNNRIGVTTSFDKHQASMNEYGDYKNRAWSNTELEFLEVWQQMQQAKEGYAGRSGARDFNWGTTGLYLGSQGQAPARHRAGPTGESPILSESCDTYMTPAGPMSFKMGHHMPNTNSLVVVNEPHPSHGHGTEMSDMLSTEVA